MGDGADKGRKRKNAATEEDELSLLQRIRDRDDLQAKELLFAKYQDLLYRFAHKYHSERLPYEDAFQLAALGLMKALRRYDPGRGVSFITFAYPTIEGELKKHYRDHLEIIRLPRPLRDLRHRLNAARLELEREGLKADVPSLARKLGVSEEAVIEVLAAQHRSSVFSLDHHCGEEGQEATLEHFLGSCDSAFEDVERELVVESALKRLPPRHRRVLEMRLRAGMTQSRIAGELNLSQMHVSRLIREAVEMLRESHCPEMDIA